MHTWEESFPGIISDMLEKQTLQLHTGVSSWATSRVSWLCGYGNISTIYDAKPYYKSVFHCDWSLFVFLLLQLIHCSVHCPSRPPFSTLLCEFKLESFWLGSFPKQSFTRTGSKLSYVALRLVNWLLAFGTHRTEKWRYYPGRKTIFLSIMPGEWVHTRADFYIIQKLGARCRIHKSCYNRWCCIYIINK